MAKLSALNLILFAHALKERVLSSSFYLFTFALLRKGRVNLSIRAALFELSGKPGLRWGVRTTN